MLKKISGFFTGFDRLSGLEINIAADNSYQISYATISVKKDNLTVDSYSGPEKISITDLDNLEQLLDPTIPLSVCVLGKGILTKKITDNVSGEASEILAKIIPNAKLNDFYCQDLNLEGSRFVSIARKDSIDKLIQKLISKFKVVNVSFSTIHTNEIIPLIDNQFGNKTFNFGGFKYTFENERLSDYVGTNENQAGNVKIGDTEYPGACIHAIASAFNVILGTEAYISISVIESQQKDFKNEKLFQKLGWAFLIFALAILTINFAIYSYYFSEMGKVSAVNETKLSNLERLNILEKELEEKKAFLKSSGWTGETSISMYCDNIASILPSSVLLSEMNINPFFMVRDGSEQKQSFDTDHILIKGECSLATDLNEFVRKLKIISWVDKVEITDYLFDEDKHKAVFKLEVAIKE